MLDNIGRKINYLRISVTDLCNLRCRYCMPEEGLCKKDHKDILRIEEIEEIVREGAKIGINKVRITGGEPLIRKGIIELVGKISRVQEIKDIAMTTNGILLKKYARELKDAGLNRVNISIDTLDKDKYEKITRGGNIADVLEGIEEAKRVGLVPIKLNIVLIGGFNDDEINDFVNLTRDENIDVRFIELMPLGQASTWAKENFIPNTTVLERFPELMPLCKDDKGSPAKYYKLPNGKGRIGLINPISSHFCSSCNRVRITADGKIKPCLHSNYEINIRSLLEQDLKLLDILKLAVESKPKEHTINDLEYEPVIRNMYQIGG
ncbi:GTP 3',8-cyclase MoaA [Wukongibacter baidiensis]|uniref:GTP 3',8-cyclase MoaA n=1 Tax=Wukongibacter baidiensis TaxID=1723361 RepID=UPI003D7FD879